MLLAAVVVILSAMWLTIISGLVIPFLVGLATKLNASTGLKGLLTILLAAAAGVLQSVVGDQGVITDQTLLNAGMTLGVSTLMFFNLYSPLNIDAKLAPDSGLGNGTAPGQFDA